MTMVYRWPKDNHVARAAFYGDPAKGEPGKRLVKVIPPYQMFYDGKPIKAISFHEKCAPALLAALTEIWEWCGRDQKVVESYDLHIFAGGYVHRKIRGREKDPNGWSNHSYGAAIDIDPVGNGLGDSTPDMPLFAIIAFKRQGAKWGGDYNGRKDGMHFEFVDNGLKYTPDMPPSPHRRARVHAIADLDEPELDEDQVAQEAAAVEAVEIDYSPTDFSARRRAVTDDPEIIGAPPDEKKPDGKGFFPWVMKIVKSKIAWATGLLGGISFTTIQQTVTDWRFVLSVAVLLIAAYIIYERGRKP